MCDQRIGNCLRASLCYRPAGQVRGRSYDEADGGAQRLIECKKRVRRQSGKQRACSRTGETPGCQSQRRLKSGEPELRHEQWMTRNMHGGSQRITGKLLPVLNNWLEQSAPRRTIATEYISSLRQIALENNCRAVIER